jgi:hypothetical protein
MDLHFLMIQLQNKIYSEKQDKKSTLLCVIPHKKWRINLTISTVTLQNKN